MLLLKLDLMEGKDNQAIQKLLDVTHRAAVKTLGDPEGDCCQIVHQHPAHEFIIQDIGLGFERSDNVVVIIITSRFRTGEQKQILYQTLVGDLKNHCGMDPQDVMISLVSNEDAERARLRAWGCRLAFGRIDSRSATRGRASAGEVIKFGRRANQI